MANIAQTVNVLQAMILTDGAKMILTPTYHVFEMYKVHQDAQKLAVDINVDSITTGGATIPQVSVSASKDKDGKVHISLCNLDNQADATFTLNLRGIVDPIHVAGRILTSEKMDARNTFEEPTAVEPTAFTGFTVDGHNLRITLPSKSVTLLAIES